MREKIRHMPIPLSGVMLGFAALGNYLKSSSVMLWGLMECIALFLLVLLILKILMFPRETAADMGNAAIAGASGTFSMGLMFLGVGAAFVNRYAGAALWGIGLLLHILLILYFMGTFVLHFRLGVCRHYGRRCDRECVWDAAVGKGTGILGTGLYGGSDGSDYRALRPYSGREALPADDSDLCRSSQSLPCGLYSVL